MPKLKGETNQDWMNRIRADRGLPPIEHENPDTIMQRTKAAACYINTSRLGREDPSALMAFMTIFHPDFSAELTDQMVRDQKAKVHQKW